MDDFNALRGSVVLEDAVIDHPDGTVEVDGYFFEVDWDEIDPPDGSAEGPDIPHEEAMAEACKQLGLPPGSM